MECTGMLGVLAQPGLLMTLIPIGVVALGFITFEVAMAITISTLPRSRFQQKWTPREQRRVLRVFCVVFAFWPISAMLIVAHLYLSLFIALLADVLALAIVALCIRWLIAGMRERRLILAGHCVRCFYDLRMHRQSHRCPECGIDLHDHPAIKRTPRVATK